MQLEDRSLHHVVVAAYGQTALACNSAVAYCTLKSQWHAYIALSAIQSSMSGQNSCIVLQQSHELGKAFTLFQICHKSKYSDEH